MITVYDIETYRKAFIVCALNIETHEKLEFEISNRRDDRNKLLGYLKKSKIQIGYNCLEFDYPVLHWFMLNHSLYNNIELPSIICDKAQEIIKAQFSSIKPSEVIIKQIDLFKVWGYDNPAKSCSLKWLEFAMRLDNIKDLPYDIEEDLTIEQIDNLIIYCHHDVKATYDFFNESKGKLALRQKLERKYKLPLISCSDVKIAEELILDSYCKLTGKNKYDVKKLRSEYDFIKADDVILPVIEFKTKKLQDWLESFRQVYLKRKTAFWKGCEIIIDGETYDIKLGGIHSKQKPFQFIKDENTLITERDCASLYPQIISKWGFYPAHLGKEFLRLYSEILNERLKAKIDIKDPLISQQEKDRLNLIIDTNKLILNSLYGKFGSEHSFVYDLKMLYSTTINNQLMMLMLIEDMVLANIKVISANTDSITTYITKDQLTDCKQIGDEWQKKTRHILEDTEYEYICYRDINNYISKTDYGSVKSKGCFEHHRDWHKNHSAMIIPLALEQYYDNNIPIEKTIKDHTDIFDFFKAVKAKGGAKYYDTYFNPELNEKCEDKLQKVNRYIVANKGSKLIKRLPALIDNDGDKKIDKVAQYRKKNPNQLDLFHFVEDVTVEKDRDSEVESGKLTVVANTVNSKDIKDYDINYRFYIEECNKIIRKIKPYDK